MRSQEEVTAVLRLTEAGLNDCAVSRLTGIPRSTVREWRSREAAGRPRPGRRSIRSECHHDFSDLPDAEYAYLLGVYLGDGCISKHPRAWRLRIFMDALYPRIIAECARAVECVMPTQHAWIKRQVRSRCVEVSMYSTHWPCLIPQHGPGKKHLRPIFLADWQKPIIERERRAFLRGLIHSDGCRIVANDRGRPSVRYHFSNLSEDIKRLYCESLDALGIPWTRPSNKQIAVYRKAAADELDHFIGPKR